MAGASHCETFWPREYFVHKVMLCFVSNVLFACAPSGKNDCTWDIIIEKICIDILSGMCCISTVTDWIVYSMKTLTLNFRKGSSVNQLCFFSIDLDFRRVQKCRKVACNCKNCLCEHTHAHIHTHTDKLFKPPS